LTELQKVEGSTTDYKVTAPSYDPIVGPEAKLRGASDNLMSEYVCMTEKGALGSVVVSMDEFFGLSWLSVPIK
jgi:hypothetical protein